MRQRPTRHSRGSQAITRLVRHAWPVAASRAKRALPTHARECDARSRRAEGHANEPVVKYDRRGHGGIRKGAERGGLSAAGGEERRAVSWRCKASSATPSRTTHLIDTETAALESESNAAPATSPSPPRLEDMMIMLKSCSHAAKSEHRRDHSLLVTCHREARSFTQPAALKFNLKRAPHCVTNTVIHSLPYR